MAKKTNKQLTDTVLADLETLKEHVEALEEVLGTDTFDEYDAGDAWDLCVQIEDLAVAIKKAVEVK